MGAMPFPTIEVAPTPPSSHSNAGVDRDISEQLLLPLCPRFRKNNDSSTKQK